MKERMLITGGNPLEGESLQTLVSLFEQKAFPIMFIEKNRMYINFINDAVRLAQESMSAWMPQVDCYRGATVYQAVAFVDADETDTNKIHVLTGITPGVGAEFLNGIHNYLAIVENGK